jgi:polysaccharide deacetylase 2 family uncharacterized protein YibQ
MTRTIALLLTALWAAGPVCANEIPPRIAVVFDDLGYTTEGLARQLLEVEVPLTFAVLPGLRESIAFAESAQAHGHEVILHVPMEPLDLQHHDPGPDALFVELEPEENRRRLRTFLDGLPAFAGVSNHMGSRCTADAALMELYLREIGSRGNGTYVLDSRTTARSVVPACAQSAGVPWVASDLFLDHHALGSPRPREQAQKLLEIALTRGDAVGIGHVRPETIGALREALLIWSEYGIRVVALSDLVHREREGERFP